MLDLSKLPKYSSPHHSRRVSGVKPQWIVIHAMSGYYKGSIAWFKSPSSQVSAHYLVSRAGEACNMVPEDRAAWHCKNFNSPSFGIELEDMIEGVKGNCLTNKTWFTEVQLKKAAQITAALMKKYSIPIEHVIGHNSEKLSKAPYYNDHKDPGPFFPWDQFKKLVKEFLNAG